VFGPLATTGDGAPVNLVAPIPRRPADRRFRRRDGREPFFESAAAKSYNKEQAEPH